MEDTKQELRLLKKGQSGLRQLLFSRMTIVLFLLIVQFVLLLGLFFRFEEYCFHYFGGSAAIAVIMVLYLQNSRMHPAARNNWLVIIMALPVFGTLLYLFFNRDLGHRMLRKRVEQVTKESDLRQQQSPNALKVLEAENSGAASMCGFTGKVSGAAVYQNTAVTYLPVGEKSWKQCCRSWKRRKSSSIWNISSWQRALCGAEFWRFWPGRRPRVWMCGCCTTEPAN